MRIDRHVYGSVTGYQTLASSDGVTPTDLQALEGFGVGQSSDPSFFRSLAGQPAWIMRSIGHRRALTRVSPGRPDDANRQTTLRVSLLIPAADWDSMLRGDIGSLTGKSELWAWRGESVLPALNASLHGPGLPIVAPAAAQKLLSILSLIERAWPSRRSVILRENSLTLDEFRVLGMLIPPQVRSGYCAVYRSLTADLSASLICLAAQSPVRPGAETFRAGQAVELSPYATALGNAGFASGKVPLEFIQSYRSFGMAPKPAASTTPKSVPRASLVPCEVIVERMPRPLLVTLFLACVVLAVVSSVCTWALAKGHYVSSSVQAVIAGLPLEGMSSEARNRLHENCSKLATIRKWTGPDIAEDVKNLKTDRRDRVVLVPTEQEESNWLQTLFSPTATNSSEQWPDAATLAQRIALAHDEARTKGEFQIVTIPSDMKLTEWLGELASDSAKPQMALPDKTADVLKNGIGTLFREQKRNQEVDTNKAIAEGKRQFAFAIMNCVNECLTRFDPDKSDAYELNCDILQKLRTELQKSGPDVNLGSISEEKLKRLQARNVPVLKQLKTYKETLEKTPEEQRKPLDKELLSRIDETVPALNRMLSTLKKWKPGPANIDVTIEMLGDPNREAGFH